MRMPSRTLSLTCSVLRQISGLELFLFGRLSLQLPPGMAPEIPICSARRKALIETNSPTLVTVASESPLLKRQANSHGAMGASGNSCQSPCDIWTEETAVHLPVGLCGPMSLIRRLRDPNDMLGQAPGAGHYGSIYIWQPSPYTIKQFEPSVHVFAWSSSRMSFGLRS